VTVSERNSSEEESPSSMLRKNHSSKNTLRFKASAENVVEVVRRPRSKSSDVMIKASIKPTVFEITEKKRVTLPQI
jgi:hypothetical protein